VVRGEIEDVQCLTTQVFEHIFETEIRTRPSRPRVGSELSTKEDTMNTTPSLRITARGRAVLGLALALPVMALSVFLASPGALADSEVTANDFEYMTVLSGDTLWSIATLVNPEADPRDVVEDIIALNQLESAVLTPGQEIALPR